MGLRLSQFRGMALAFVLAVSATVGLPARPADAWCFEGISKWASGYRGPWSPKDWY